MGTGRELRAARAPARPAGAARGAARHRGDRAARAAGRACRARRGALRRRLPRLHPRHGFHRRAHRRRRAQHQLRQRAGHARDAARLRAELPLPIFDWGQARTRRAEATYLQSVARVRDVAVRARSEARESWHGWRTAYDLAKHYRDEVVPLRKFIVDETQLRYNGMLASVWDLLGEARNHIAAVNNTITAQRDFWIADTDLRTALTGTSPGALAAMRAGGSEPAAQAQGH
ncbi:TolC family protein [Ramlibacter montanisoli]|uniref:TolC family protein n=1 Tax=Ramlibacter montanisoli TaxID=2732512 RepID=UPI00359F9A69